MPDMDKWQELLIDMHGRVVRTEETVNMLRENAVLQKELSDKIDKAYTLASSNKDWISKEEIGRNKMKRDLRIAVLTALGSVVILLVSFALGR